MTGCKKHAVAKLTEISIFWQRYIKSVLSALHQVGPRRLFLTLLPVVLIFRFWLAITLPLTGDEAYFYWWGKLPDLGYYDHPPMIGWWLAVLTRVAETEWWLRLPQIAQPTLLALAAALTLRGTAAGWWAALFILLAPANIWNVAITTDTPLVYFSVLSALAWIHAARNNAPHFYLLAGVLLAGAVLSKYFAALLGCAYFIDVLLRPARRRWLGLALTAAPVLLALALMGWWNAAHCWPNFMFNFINRNEYAELSWQTPLIYVLSLFYLFTPLVLWWLARHRAIWRAAWQTPDLRATLLIGIVPLALLGALSFVREIGLHWLLAFVPPVLLLVARALPENSLRRLTGFLGGLALVQVAVIITIIQLPLETWQKNPLYNGIVLAVENRRLLDELERVAPDYLPASDGYTSAATLGYNARRYFFVFGEGSRFARQDDILTDLRDLVDRNIAVLRKTAPAPKEYNDYFRAVDIKSFVVRDVRYYIVLGQGFNYAAYRDKILTAIRRKYYALPAFLPCRACYFCDRYFPGESCRKERDVAN
jgi:hypothetical protein